MTDERKQKREELAVVGLVSTGHFFSHFYILTIPPVLPLIQKEFGVGFTELGAMISAYALCSALFQFPAGILADRFGARYFLIGGMAIISLCAFAMGFAPSIFALIVIAAIAGTADSVFHPADYAVITAHIRSEWLGKSYAMHTFAGFLGFAVAPTVMVFMLTMYDWRFSLSALGAVGFLFAIVLLLQGGRLEEHKAEARRAEAAKPSPAGQKTGIGAVLMSPVILMMFAYYVATSLAGNGINSFSNSALIILYDFSLTAANGTLAGYLWGTAIGVLVGGLLSNYLNRFDMIVLGGYLIAAAIVVGIGLAVVPAAAVVAGMFFAGFVIGFVMPSRDLMVKSITPAGSTGKVFGFVSSGFGVAGFFGPLMYGSIMDSGNPAVIYYVSAAVMLVIIAFAIAAGRIARPAAAVAAQPAE